MAIVKACVDQSVLKRASRMFPGDVRSRITEIIQNSRRAGAKNIYIKQKPVGSTFYTEVIDDGEGVSDFSTLFCLGKSNWDPSLDDSEDPAGMGIFCLSPRATKVASRGAEVTVGGDAWYGEPVEIKEIDGGDYGTKLEFVDEEWTKFEVEFCSAFSGMQVHLNGELIASQDFLDKSKPATYVKDLGVYIQVIKSNSVWHHEYSPGVRVVVNFHGQIIQFALADLTGGSPIWCLPLAASFVGVELTGDPTGLRMILPSRSGLVKNHASAVLGAECEKELYRHVDRKKIHRLNFANFLRAKELGVPIPESQQTLVLPFYASETFDSYNPLCKNDSALSKDCVFWMEGEHLYKVVDITNQKTILKSLNLSDVVLGYIPGDFIGYKWCDNIKKAVDIKVIIGPEVYSSNILETSVTCVEHLICEIKYSDGSTSAHKIFVAPDPSVSNSYLITTELKYSHYPEFLWDVLGGFSSDDDYSLERNEFFQQLSDFWISMSGPTELSRQKVFSAAVENLIDWDRIVVHRSGLVEVYNAGQKAVLRPVGE